MTKRPSQTKVEEVWIFSRNQAAHKMGQLDHLWKDRGYDQSKACIGPVSTLVVLGIIILFLSLVLPILPLASHVQTSAPGAVSNTLNGTGSGTAFSGTSTLRQDLWQGISTLGWIILVIGILRTIYLRRQAAVVEKAKDEAGLRGERMTADVRGKNASYIVTRLHQLNDVIRDHATRRQLSTRDVARVADLIFANSRPHETDAGLNN